MSVAPPWYSPSASALFLKSVYIVINVQDILYGIELVLYFKTMHVLLSHRAERTRCGIFYALFSTVMLVLITVWVATQAHFGEETWVLNGDNAEAPSEYWANDWYMGYGTTATIVLQLMTDGLMIYRCRMIWDSYRVIVVPSILWLATLVLGILVYQTSSAQGENFLLGVASDFGLAYYTISVFLNSTSTMAICYRVVWQGRVVKECLGHEHASVYFELVAIIVESVLPYTFSGIAFLVSFGIGSPTSIAFACVYMLLMCISPQLVILRVAMGRAWEKDRGKPSHSRIEFSPGSDSRLSDKCEIHLQMSPNVYHLDGDVKV